MTCDGTGRLACQCGGLDLTSKCVCGRDGKPCPGCAKCKPDAAAKEEWRESYSKFAGSRKEPQGRLF